MSGKDRTRWRRRRTVLPAVLVFGCLGSFLSAARAEDALVEELLDKMLQTQVESSRTKLVRQVLLIEPSEPVRSFCEGYQLLLAGDDAGAATKLDAALQRKKQFAQAPYMYGDAYHARGRRAEAAAAYQRALAADSKFLPARLALNELLLQCAAESADPDSTARLRLQAIEVAARGLEDHPQNVQLQVALGDALAAAGRRAEAISSYLVVDQLEPGRADIESKLGILYADEGDPKRAQAYLAMALQDDPDNPAAVRRLADLYGKEGQVVRALLLLGQGWKLVRDPMEQGRIRRAIGFGLLVFGERVKSREHLEQAHELLQDEESALALAWVDSTSSPTDRRAYELARIVLPAWNFRWLDEEKMKTDTCWPPPEAAPQLVRAAEPVYPPEARRRGNEGTVFVRGLISPEGQVVEAKVEESSGYADLDAAALAAMRRTSVLPAVSSGASVACWIEVPFRFSLHHKANRLYEGGMESTRGAAGEKVIQFETPVISGGK